ncbi:hypothetical protein HOLleu_20897 [Holothuria leucospilota]|uniref:Paired domain-containing protein n=1 Tax=Holothuria leucospilota TaxID=206669 RepID=A0A9Q1H6F9_HOLLE|nr:hypothetical protein HOLleu_20897 [Holothuria leucospilota]
MPPQIPNPVRSRIVTLHTEGMSNTAIKQKLDGEGQNVHRTGILRVIRRFKTTGTTNDRARSGRPKKCSPVIETLIDKLLQENDELTSPDLQREILKETGLRISLTTIKTTRRKIGWVCTGTKYCQLIRKPNMRKRLVFAPNCLSTNETFERVIFSDECSIELNQHALLTFRKEGDTSRRKLKPKAKHPVKVHVWAGISTEGVNSLVMR